MSDLGRLLILAGVVAVVVGLVITFLGPWLPFGRLPGDIRYSRGNVRVFVPLVSCLLLSILLTIILNVVIRLLNR